VLFASLLGSHSLRPWWAVCAACTSFSRVLLFANHQKLPLVPLGSASLFRLPLERPSSLDRTCGCVCVCFAPSSDAPVPTTCVSAPGAPVRLRSTLITVRFASVHPALLYRAKTALASSMTVCTLSPILLACVPGTWPPSKPIHLRCVLQCVCSCQLDRLPNNNIFCATSARVGRFVWCRVAKGRYLPCHGQCCGTVCVACA